ncbi:MAG: thiolase family protein [Thermoproteota archaeon]
MEAKASIVGVGCTHFGSVLETPEIKGLSPYELAVKAAFEALDDAGLEPKDIDAFFIGSMQTHTSGLYSWYSQLCDWLGMELKPGIHFETACSTTNTGLGLAAMAVKSGTFNRVLVLACEVLSSEPLEHPGKRRPVDPLDLWFTTDFGVDQAYSYTHAYDIATAYGAIPAIAYAKKYGLTIEKLEEALFSIASTVRLHSSMNPKAFIKKTLEEEARELGFRDAHEFWVSKYNPYLAWPIRVKNALNPVDGASAYIVTTPEEAKCFTDTPIDVLGFYWSVKNYPWYGDPTAWYSDNIAFQKAYQISGIEPKDIDYLHVHDCMQTYWLLLSELSGYVPKGEAWKAAIEGRFRFDGDRPMTTSGGRHGKGHAFGASAGAEIYEAVKQMRGEVGRRQIVPEPEIAVIHNHGYGMHSAVTVLKRR